MLQFACSPFITAEEFLDSACACALDPEIDEALIEELIDQATDMLYILSGGRIFGRCSKTVYPMGDEDCWTPVLRERPWWTQGIRLRGPNPTVTEIIIDGEILAESEYAVVIYNGEYILRRINESWPSSNDPFGTTSAHTWTIEFEFGLAADKLTKMATTELACELITFSLTGVSKLPNGVTAVNIQGVSATLRDRAEALKENSDFIPAVARFLGVYAPNGRNVSGVWSPELDSEYSLIEVQ